jgi:hypothetical protein
MSGRRVANHAPPTSAILVAQAIAPPAVKVSSSEAMRKIINRETVMSDI